MALSRRRLFVYTAATAGVLAFTVTRFKPWRNGARETRTILTNHFGDTISTSEACNEFVDAFAATLPDTPHLPTADILEQQVITSFFQSTTIQGHMERDDPLYFLNIFNPYSAPCQSMLNAPL